MENWQTRTTIFSTESGAEYSLTEFHRRENESERSSRLVRWSRKVGLASISAYEVSFDAENPPLTGNKFSAKLLSEDGQPHYETSTVVEVRLELTA